MVTMSRLQTFQFVLLLVLLTSCLELSMLNSLVASFKDSLLGITTTTTTTPVSLSPTSSESSTSVYQYNICNGLCNQLLYHSASIAIAVEQGKEVIEIPNHFIFNGVQHSDDDVLPSSTNSVPFSVAFDSAYFLQEVESLGIRARFVSFDFDDVAQRKPIPCAGMQSLRKADPDLVLKVLKAFRPSDQIQTMIKGITDAIEDLNPKQGVCLHHRDGQDWHDHCARWGSINDGVYRGNCLGVPGRSFVESLEDRTLDGASVNQWVYYCGDHQVPGELKELPHHVFNRDDFMSQVDRDAVTAIGSGQPVRDLWALIDFYVCSGLETFIGNSVSTFSAIQIAMRDGDNTFWYNSQSIPLADIWKTYQIPIVYTYTEMSQQSGKHLLQVSIASVRRHMPNNKIHILYHGTDDKAFLQWLDKQNVIIHNHDPAWRPQIEIMRKNGDPATSHLFLHEGNHFGSWQRIDIPLFLNTEYALKLDSDTIVLRPFTLADFGLEMTYGIAMSAELWADNVPSNAGVTLLNIPYMRQTYHDFLEFVYQHVHSANFNHPSPADQGAYLVYYANDIRFLPRAFNMKPYWKKTDAGKQEPFILHFHGAKPHDYLKRVIGDQCDKSSAFLCNKVMRLPYLCRAMQLFSEYSDPVAYCNASFEEPAKAVFCNEVLDALYRQKDECLNFDSFLEDVMEHIPNELGLSKGKIINYIRKNHQNMTVVNGSTGS